MTALDHIVLTVRDVGATTEIYRRVLGIYDPDENLVELARPLEV